MITAHQMEELKVGDMIEAPGLFASLPERLVLQVVKVNKKSVRLQASMFGVPVAEMLLKADGDKTVWEQKG